MADSLDEIPAKLDAIGTASGRLGEVVLAAVGGDRGRHLEDDQGSDDRNRIEDVARGLAAERGRRVDDDASFSFSPALRSGGFFESAKN